MELLTMFTDKIGILFTVVGILAFLVSIITDVTKSVWIFARIPTDLQVIVLSIILCLLTYFTYTSYFSIAIRWYYITACIIVAFIVSFISMYGWEKFTVLYTRFKK